MTEKQAIQASKFLSMILRHKPETIGVRLDANGWTDVEELLQLLQTHGHPLTHEELAEIVSNNSKQRFALSEDGRKIRASQGHSIDVELGLAPKEPPEYLYHGTIAAALSAIRQEGLQRMSRQHVHLSKDVSTATVVGQRRGKPIVLTINSGTMFRDGFLFFLSANGVWLTNEVPPHYIDFRAIDVLTD